MDVMLVGYGRMGKEIETVLRQRGHRIQVRVDSSGCGDLRELTPEALGDVDGVIEFALAEGISDRIAEYARSGKPAVIGTTGWDALVDDARTQYRGGAGAILRGNNFALGAHIFLRIAEAAAGLIDRTDEYDVALTEYHHKGKADYPSGTALLAAGRILSALKRKTRIVRNLPEGPIPPDALQVASVRVGSVPGVHEMFMDSPADTITIRHEARSRGGFALGAVRGLEWLEGRTGWYEVDDFIDDLLTGADT